MATKNSAAEIPQSPEQRRFAALCIEDMDKQEKSIGVLAEKRLHAVLKRFYCPDAARHERKLTAEWLQGSETELTDAATQSERDRFVADCLTEDGCIFEIQTGGFFPLVKKLHFYLCATNCKVTVVHPIIAKKWVRWVDPATGELSARRLSPRRGTAKDVAKELYWIAPFIGDARFTVRLPALEIEEWKLQNGWGKDHKHGASRVERYPLALAGETVLQSPADYAAVFLPSPESLPSPFSAAQYAQATHIRGRATYAVLHLLTDLGILLPAEPQGRAGRWQRAQNGGEQREE